MARALSESVSFDQEPEPDHCPLEYVPIQAELVEATKALVPQRHAAPRFHVVWPEPGDRELIYATDPRYPPERVPILRGPRFEGGDTFFVEVKQGGIIGMLRFKRIKARPRPGTGGPIWESG